MVTSQIMEMVKTEYSLPKEDTGAKYVSQEKSDRFSRVFDAAKRTQESDFGNGQEYLAGMINFEQRKIQTA